MQFLATVARRRFTEYAESSISTLSCDVLCWFVEPIGGIPDIRKEHRVRSPVIVRRAGQWDWDEKESETSCVAVTQLCVSFSRFQKALRRER
jgi:hypothetical protein